MDTKDLVYSTKVTLTRNMGVWWNLKGGAPMSLKMDNNGPKSLLRRTNRWPQQPNGGPMSTTEFDEIDRVNHNELGVKRSTEAKGAKKGGCLMILSQSHPNHEIR